MINLGTILTDWRVWALILAVFVLIGGFLRFHELSVQPYWMDEGYTINAVLSVVERGKTTLDSGLPYSCPTYCYPTAAVVETLGHDAASYRVLAALAGTALIVVIFFIARSWFSLQVALLTSFFAAFSYFQIAWSRQARWYTLFELFFWIALFFFYKALCARNPRSRFVYAFLCTGATILAIATHGLGALLPLIFVGWFAIDRLLSRPEAKRSFTKMGLYAAAAIATAALFLQTAPGTSLLSQIDPFFGLPYYGGFYLGAYWFFLLFSIIALWQSRYVRATWFLAFSIAAYALPLMFLTDIIHYRYFFHLTPALFMLAGIGIETLQARISARRYKVLFIAAVLGVFLTVGGGVVAPQSFYLLEADNPAENPGRNYYAYTPQPDWNAAYDYIAENRQSGDIIISSMPQFNKIFLGEPGYWLKFSYLRDGKEGNIINDREYYVGAPVVDDLEELQRIAAGATGFVVFDHMATDGRIPEETLEYVRANFEEVFFDRVNYYSRVWVYRF